LLLFVVVVRCSLRCCSVTLSVPLLICYVVVVVVVVSFVVGYVYVSTLFYLFDCYVLRLLLISLRLFVTFNCYVRCTLFPVALPLLHCRYVCLVTVCCAFTLLFFVDSLLRYRVGLRCCCVPTFPFLFVGPVALLLRCCSFVVWMHARCCCR
jgi:hypothetical protein